jgi:hypothetical protein
MGKLLTGLKGEPVEELDEFCYLGSMATKDVGSETDVNIRINKAKSACKDLGSLTPEVS